MMGCNTDTYGQTALFRVAEEVDFIACADVTEVRPFAVASHQFKNAGNCFAFSVDGNWFLRWPRAEMMFALFIVAYQKVPRGRVAVNLQAAHRAGDVGIFAG